jgi:hypothetical protein
VFTYTYWCSEVMVFKTIYQTQDSSEPVLVGALKGLVVLVHHTLESNPDRHQDILLQFHECFTLAEQVQSREWVWQQMPILQAHGLPRIQPL